MARSIWLVIAAIVCVLVIIWTLIGAAKAQTIITPPVCTSMAAVAANLKTEYGELPTAGGLIKGGLKTMIFANLRSGSWTMVAAVNGCTQVVAMGDGWVMIPVVIFTEKAI